jgi:hypothetical protein
VRVGSGLVRRRPALMPRPTATCVWVALALAITSSGGTPVSVSQSSRLRVRRISAASTRRWLSSSSWSTAALRRSTARS